MKLYECIVEDGNGDIYCKYEACRNRKELSEVFSHFNVSVILVKDVTAGFFTDQSVALLDEHLKVMGWGQGERVVICALLQSHIDSYIQKVI